MRNSRSALLNFVLLLITFCGVYLVTISLRGVQPGYILAMAILFYTGTALNRTRLLAFPPRFPILREDPAQLGLPPFDEVVFPSRDGIELSGWFIPAKGNAAVILVHSLGGSRAQMRHYARSLAAAGFGVLLFDLRAHARSGGDLSTFGWSEQRDLLGAYDFLARKSSIDRAHIGVLGFSMGAQIAVRAAAASSVFAAVWIDGPVPVVYADHFAGGKRSLRGMFFAPWWWLVYNTLEWMTGMEQPAPLVEIVPAVSPRPLMVAASGSDRMVAFARLIFEAAGEPRSFWPLDEIPFGSGILEKGEEYDQKLVGFFNREIGGS